MKIRPLIVCSLVLLALILAACGPAAPAATEPPSEFNFAAAPQAPADESMFGLEPEAAPASGANAQGGASAKSDSAIYNTGAPVDAAVYQRMVIKNAEIKLLVKDSDIAMDGVTQLVGDVQGYIVSSQIWFVDYGGANYKYATITIGIPADQFEAVLRRLRNMSIRVLNETASGQDVTDQYVDLQAQLVNLEATRDRIKTFLDDAKSVDEALRINQQLSEIEAQIEQVKGQMNYLADRSAFSTITIQIEPDLPPATPTPSPTPRPTATPVPWKPGETLQQSTQTLTSAYQGIVDFLIWFFVVLVPILLPPALIIWFVVRLLRRKPKG
ncbi:MAG: hypothetical protein HFACDABA_02887 [Anaerolineales bacterium]|nr:hypothetical protein [Anaerolineales bacterium]